MDSTQPKLKRTAEEEDRLFALYQETGEMRCYYCDKLINEETDKFSTEFGIFYTCLPCFDRYGNPDDDISMRPGSGETKSKPRHQTDLSSFSYLSHTSYLY